VNKRSAFFLQNLLTASKNLAIPRLFFAFAARSSIQITLIPASSSPGRSVTFETIMVLSWGSVSGSPASINRCSAYEFEKGGRASVLAHGSSANRRNLQKLTE
jgi:hypothetical protein